MASIEYHAEMLRTSGTIREAKPHINFLRNRGSHKAIAELFSCGVTHNHRSISEKSREVLVKLGDRAVPSIVRIGLKEDAHRVGIISCRLLQKIGTKKAVDALIKHGLKNADVNTVSNSAVALGEIGDPRAIKPLIKSLSMKQIESDIKTVFAGQGIHNALVAFNSEAVELLLKALKTDDYRVLSPAILALGQIGDKRALLPLMKMAGKNVPRLNKQIREAINQIQGAKRA